jgi:hypothetical protein
MKTEAEMRRQWLVLLVLIGACDSSSPSDDRVLHVSGEVLEADHPPAPSLEVILQAWPEPAVGGSDSASVRTDAAGRYTADLGPFPNARIDSLRVRVIQSDCLSQVTTELWQRDPAIQGDALVVPSLGLSYRLFPAEFGTAAQMCSAIAPSSWDLSGDYASLALWIDQITDSVRGRWRLNHSVSIGDDYGYFSGLYHSDRITLQLRPTQPTPCTGLQLDILVGGHNGSTLGAGSLAGDGSCSVPSTTVRFFKGAVLSEVLPPAGG